MVGGGTITRQDAETRLAELERIRFLTGANSNYELDEIQKLTEGLALDKYKDDPAYLESAGQTRLEKI